MTTTITHKRALKSIFVVALLVVSLFGVSTKAFAANSYNGTITTSTSWKTLATSTTGFNCNVAVVDSNRSNVVDRPISWQASQLGAQGS